MKMAFLVPPAVPPASSFGASPNPPPQPSNFSPVLPTRRRPSPAFTFRLPFLPPPTYRIDTYDVAKRNKLPQPVIDELLSPLRNRDLTEDDILSAVKGLTSWFQSNYYPCARVEVVSLPTKRKPHLQLVSIEPNLVVLTTVAVGADNKPDTSARLITRERVITNALGVQEGEPFIWSPTGFARLIALGIFEHINADVKLHTPEDAELILYLRERKPGRVEPGAGISSDGRVYGDISIVDSNLMGRAQRLRIEWQKRIDKPRSSGGIAFEDMRIGARVPVSFRMRAYRDANADRDLPQEQQHSRPPIPTSLQPNAPLRNDVDRDGILVDFGYRPGSKTIMFNLSPMMEHVHQSGMNVGSEACVQGVLQTSVTHATRPPVDLPRLGHIVRLENAVGTKLFDAPQLFQKTVLKIAKYIGVGPRSSLACGITVGMGSENLPSHEQKLLGGHGTVRGYDYGELGRHRSYVVGKVEFRVPLAFADRDQPQVPDEATENNADEVPPKPKTTNAKPSATSKSRSSEGNQGVEGSEEVDGEEDGGSFMDRLPPLVGVLFGDAAVGGDDRLSVLGSSYGMGLRIGGIIAVDWTTTMDGRKSRVHLGLVDRGL